MNDTTSHELPTSGQLLGFITDHLGFREAVGTDRTAQRVFQGERVRPESIRAVVAQLVRAFWPDGDECGREAAKRAEFLGDPSARVALDAERRTSP